LSLLDPGGFYNKDKQSPLVFRLARAPGINKILRYVTPRFFIKNTLKEVYYDKTKLTDKKIDTYRDLILRENNRESFINRSKSSSVDYTQRLKSITIPTQILWGHEDEWISVENAKLFSKALPNNRVDIMQETGHLPMEERPYESLELLLNFINDN
jgi:pimeloyl-ACP methyl ester carboxylesterase